MRRIRKSHEPKALAEHRAHGVGVTYDNAPKDAMRRALFNEQEGLCAYCMARLTAADDGAMTIEHHVAQSDDDAHALEWSNLLGVCLGGRGLPRSQQWCDARRGNKVLTLNPTDAEIEREIRYRDDGTIVAVNPANQDTLDKLLGLNLPHHSRARQSVFDAFFEVMKRVKLHGTWTHQDFATQLAVFTRGRDGPTRAYIGIVEWYVRAQAQKAAARSG